MDVIEQEFKDRGILQGLTYVFHASDAIQIVRRCHQLNLRIFGIDVFSISDEGVQIMDYIDYSSGEMKRKNGKDAGFWNEAEQYIQERSTTGFFFEIVHY